MIGIIKLRQKTWLKPYTETNRELRRYAKNDFLKNISNAVLGKRQKM